MVLSDVRAQRLEQRDECISAVGGLVGDGRQIVVGNIAGCGDGVGNGLWGGAKTNLCSAPGCFHVEHGLTECGVRGEFGGAGASPDGRERAVIIRRERSPVYRSW